MIGMRMTPLLALLMLLNARAAPPVPNASSCPTHCPFLEPWLICCSDDTQGGPSGICYFTCMSFLDKCVNSCDCKNTSHVCKGKPVPPPYGPMGHCHNCTQSKTSPLLSEVESYSLS